MKFSLISCILRPIWTKFGKGNVHKMLMSKNRLNQSHTLRKNVNEFLFVLSILLSDMDEIPSKTVEYNAVQYL
jgi:hypothetical protein